MPTYAVGATPADTPDAVVAMVPYTLPVAPCVCAYVPSVCAGAYMVPPDDAGAYILPEDWQIPVAGAYVFPP